MTQQGELVVPGRASNDGTSVPAARSVIARWLEPDSTVPVYLGVGFITVGLALIAFTWSRVAGEVAVSLQLPYIASGGFAGIGCVIVGCTIISVAAKRRDAAVRFAQLDELAAVLSELRSAPAALDHDEPT